MRRSLDPSTGPGSVTKPPGPILVLAGPCGRVDAYVESSEVSYLRPHASGGHVWARRAGDRHPVQPSSQRYHGLRRRRGSPLHRRRHQHRPSGPLHSTVQVGGRGPQGRLRPVPVRAGQPLWLRLGGQGLLPRRPECARYAGVPAHPAVEVGAGYPPRRSAGSPHRHADTHTPHTHIYSSMCIHYIHVHTYVCIHRRPSQAR